ncbi:UNVERIFIED_CONTAM: protein LATERAL ORGAN BOUNDARIES [Sesamum angustifolium]|uniref:Protein LATERAL ORGAN BOUNDARIES n=1 Tax=Sesamum angustifolium TaxID=2727405 RepID=A0AAW2Q9U7_9LAMI
MKKRNLGINYLGNNSFVAEVKTYIHQWLPPAPTTLPPLPASSCGGSARRAASSPPISPRRAAEIRQCSQDLRRKQRLQAPPRRPAPPEGRRCQLSRLRGGGPCPRPCRGAITFLQRQVDRLQKELDAANADLIRYACNGSLHQPSTTPMVVPSARQRPMVELNRSIANEGGGGFYQTPSSFSFPYYNPPWNDHYSPHGGGFGGSI